MLQSPISILRRSCKVLYYYKIRWSLKKHRWMKHIWLGILTCLKSICTIFIVNQGWPWNNKSGWCHMAWWIYIIGNSQDSLFPAFEKASHFLKTKFKWLRMRSFGKQTFIFAFKFTLGLFDNLLFIIWKYPYVECFTITDGVFMIF